MPIATRGAVKNISSQELENLGAEIILSNTYHLLLRPGMKRMKKYGGLHSFMNWKRPILTDSGGYQVFSLSRHRKITRDGVRFRDPGNGNFYSLTPEKVVRIQKVIGSDILMVLDECPPYPVSHDYAEKSMNLTLAWARRSINECKKIFQKNASVRPLIFGIIQGSTFQDLRISCTEEILKMGFDGLAVGGVAVGEPRKKMYEVLSWVLPRIPPLVPRYLMGVGRPEEIVRAVSLGIDMFDCVIPTREARHGKLYSWNENISFTQWLQGKTKKSFYTTLAIKKSRYSQDLTPIHRGEFSKYSRAYLHHLFRTGEGLGFRLATLQNLSFYLELMEKIRGAIRRGLL